MGNTNSSAKTQAISHDDTGWTDWPPADTELLLSAMRAATLRAELDANEIKTVVIALSAGMITPEYAMTWLHDIGLVDQVIVDEVRS